VTSARKQFANRANARRSTGPKSVQGKARVSRNALRHGFARQNWAEGTLRDVARAEEVNALARAIAGDHASAAHLARALAVATAQHDLVLVRQARHGVEAAVGRARTEDAPAESQPGEFIDPALLTRVERLDRYERLALTRRRRAIAALDAAVRDRPAEDFAEQSQLVKSQ
jgi:hypothetical protein